MALVDAVINSKFNGNGTRSGVSNPWLAFFRRLGPGTGTVTGVTGTLPIVVAPASPNPNVSVKIATALAVGVVKVDGVTITIAVDGTISAVGGAVIPGPYADDTAAAGAGVAVGSPYYLASGFVVIRLV